MEVKILGMPDQFKDLEVGHFFLMNGWPCIKTSFGESLNAFNLRKEKTESVLADSPVQRLFVDEPIKLRR